MRIGAHWTDGHLSASDLTGPGIVSGNCLADSGAGFGDAELTSCVIRRVEHLPQFVQLVLPPLASSLSVPEASTTPRWSLSARETPR